MRVHLFDWDNGMLLADIEDWELPAPVSGDMLEYEGKDYLGDVVRCRGIIRQVEYCYSVSLFESLKPSQSLTISISLQ